MSHGTSILSILIGLLVTDQSWQQECPGYYSLDNGDHILSPGTYDTHVVRTKLECAVKCYSLDAPGYGVSHATHGGDVECFIVSTSSVSTEVPSDDDDQLDMTVFIRGKCT